MPRTRILFFILLSTVLLINPVFVSADLPSAVNYLKNQTPDAWITQALVAAGQTDIATNHLTSVNGTLATDYAKAILALAALGQNPATFGNVDYIAQLQSFYNNNQTGEVTLVNDDAWAILALASVGQTQSAQVTDSKNFLINNQNDDGGWGYQVGGASDTNDTAAAIMALVELGLNSNDQVIVDALAYLQSAQNDDGGFGWDVDSDSDSGSDAWVVSALIKLGQNPTTWQQAGNDPISHLESLQDTDGGFWWVDPATEPAWNNKAMTSFVVIALADKTYPITYFQDQNSSEDTYYLRLEGQDSIICDANISGTTALDLIESAAEVCGYSYTIQDTAFGPYLSEVAGESAQGLSGWLYFVNFSSPPVGAADYVLSEGDEVLWYYGDWGWPPTRVTLDKIEIDPGEVIDVFVEYSNGADWLPLPNAGLKVGEEIRTAQADGHFNLTINQNGIYQVYVDMEGYVRSQKVIVTVGDTVSQNVSLQVEVDQSGSGNVGGQSIALVVSQNQINFGQLKPGQTNSDLINLKNEGTVSLNVGSNVSGDSVFTQGLEINNEAWPQYSETLSPAQTKSAQISLTIPTDYLASGLKTGELIFWATSQ